MRLHWKTCLHGAWCPFETVVLPDANVEGILLIWSAAEDRVVYIAQGGIAKSLRWARQFEPFLRHPDLRVTWANVPEDSRGGVLTYLTEALRPLHRDRPNGAEPISANLPWDGPT